MNLESVRPHEAGRFAFGGVLGEEGQHPVRLSHPLRTVDTVKPNAERFWKKVRRDGSLGCWEWRAYRNAKGYGMFNVNKRPQMAHRVAYGLLVGPVPEGAQLDHLCRNRACVNPAHLEPVSPRENQLRGEGFAGENARKTHCPQNHPYDDENTYWNGRWRQCRICRADAWRRWYHAQKRAS